MGARPGRLTCVGPQSTTQSSRFWTWGPGCVRGSPGAPRLRRPPRCPAPSTCLYLAGRLQPQACSRPSSLRTCSRTWRYCSRFCSRLAEDVQSLVEEGQVTASAGSTPAAPELSLLDLDRPCRAPI